MLPIVFDLNEQYKRFPEISQDEVLKLVEWIRHQPHMPNLGEKDILLYYHACNYRTEYTKQVLDSSLTYHTHVEEFFSNLDVENIEFKRTMDTVLMCPLPKLSHEGHRIIFCKLKNFNSSNFNFDLSNKLLSVVFMVLLGEDGIRDGHRYVLDMSGATISHLTRINIMSLKKLIYYVKDALPLRLTGMHFINPAPFMDKVFSLINPFLTKELSSLIHVHNTINDLYKFVPLDILPQEYDGPEQSLMELHEKFYDKIRSRRDEILQVEKCFRIEEKLRPGKPKNSSQLFGVEGNFKKLDFD